MYRCAFPYPSNTFPEPHVFEQSELSLKIRLPYLNHLSYTYDSRCCKKKSKKNNIQVVAACFTILQRYRGSTLDKSPSR